MKEVFIENFIFVACVLFVFWCLGFYHADAYNVEGIWVSQNRPAVGSWAFDGVNKYTWQENSVDVLEVTTGIEYSWEFGDVEEETEPDIYEYIIYEEVADSYDYSWDYEEDAYLDEYGNIWWED